MKNLRFFLRAVALLGLMLAVASCGRHPQPSSVMKVGKPYTVMGKTYYPHIQNDYDEIGMASWYGPGFHGKYTANGEQFDKHDFTCAHRTLPMPSIVRVTDIATGRSVVARVNDRGPFSQDRIIDLSEAAASSLGIKGRGLAKVRVQYLSDETEQYLAGISSPGQRLSYKTGSVPPPVIILPPQPVYSAPTPQQEGTYADVMENRNVGAVAPTGSVEVKDLGSVSSSRSSPAKAAFTPPPENADYAYPNPPAAGNSTRPVSNGSGGVYVQAGSFSIAKNAENLVERLSSIGQAFISEQVAGDRLWYRVRLGPIEDRAEADNILQKVTASGLRDAKIVQD